MPHSSLLHFKPFYYFSVRYDNKNKFHFSHRVNIHPAQLYDSLHLYHDHIFAVYEHIVNAYQSFTSCWVGLIFSAHQPGVSVRLVFLCYK